MFVACVKTLNMTDTQTDTCPNIRYFQTHYQFQLDFQKVDQHTGGKWFIHGTKHYKDNQLQSLEHPLPV